MNNNPMSDEEFKEYMKFDDSHEMDIKDVEWQRQPLGIEVNKNIVYMNDLIILFGIQTTEETIEFLNRQQPPKLKKQKKNK